MFFSVTLRRYTQVELFQTTPSFRAREAERDKSASGQASGGGGDVPLVAGDLSRVQRSVDPMHQNPWTLHFTDIEVERCRSVPG